MATESIRRNFAVSMGRVIRDSVATRVLVLLLLLTAAPVYSMVRITAFSNGDIWWHLRTGLWILQNHSVPRSGLFSQYGDRPWVATSWGFEVLTAGVYKLLGLRAIPVVLAGFKLGLAAVTFLLARGWARKFLGRRSAFGRWPVRHR